MSDPRHDVEANALINEYTIGIVREDVQGPIEEVRSHLLKDAIRDALEAAERRGIIKGLGEASEIAASSNRHHQKKHGQTTDRASQQSHLAQALASQKIELAIDQRIEALETASLSTAKGE